MKEATCSCLRYTVLLMMLRVCSSEEEPYDIKRTSASLSSTFQGYVAENAIDGDNSGRAAHSKCSEKGLHSLTINFEFRSCIKEVVVYQVKTSIYRSRMNGAEVSVIDKADSHILCGAIKVTNILTAEGQTYTISCGLACGDGIVLSTVNGAKERCIAVFEMTATGYHGNSHHTTLLTSAQLIKGLPEFLSATTT